MADIGGGTGRALPALRDEVGTAGTVVGLDFTSEMLAVARGRGRTDDVGLVLADATRLPFAEATLDGIFAAGLLTHLDDPAAGLAELARVTRAHGVLALFHPSGRLALAARHGRALRPDEILAHDVLTAALTLTGWRLDTYADDEDRFFARAHRL